jgi:hypothetical protein
MSSSSSAPQVVGGGGKHVGRCTHASRAAGHAGDHQGDVRLDAVDREAHERGGPVRRVVVMEGDVGHARLGAHERQVVGQRDRPGQGLARDAECDRLAGAEHPDEIQHQQGPDHEQVREGEDAGQAQQRVQPEQPGRAQPGALHQQVQRDGGDREQPLVRVRLELQRVVDDPAVEQQQGGHAEADPGAEPAPGQQVGRDREHGQAQEHGHAKPRLGVAEHEPRRVLDADPAQRERAGRRVQLTQEVPAQSDVVGPPGFVVVERPGQQVPQPEFDQPGPGDEGRDGEQVADRNATKAADGRDPDRSRRRPGPGRTDAHAQILRPDIGPARAYALSCVARGCDVPPAATQRLHAPVHRGHREDPVVP